MFKKTKGYAQGGKMKTKGMKAGGMTTKGYKMGGKIAMTTKGMKKGGKGKP